MAAKGHGHLRIQSFDIFTTTSLFGKLREHELKMTRLNVQENEDKHMRNIALKAARHKNNQDSSDESEGETLSLLSKKFSKFLKNNCTKNHTHDRYVARNLVISMLTNIHAMVVMNRII